MIYRVRHVTTYDYEDPVSVSHHILRLTPHNSLPPDLQKQTRILDHREPTGRPLATRHCRRLLRQRNRHVFHPARSLMSGMVVVKPSSETGSDGAARRLTFAASPTWESDARYRCHTRSDDRHRIAYQFAFDSQRAWRARPGIGWTMRSESFHAPTAPCWKPCSISRIAHQPRFPVRYQGNRSEHAGGNILRKTPRRLPGFFAFADRMHAVAGFARTLHQRLPADAAAAGPAASGGCRCLARVVRDVVPRSGVGGF